MILSISFLCIPLVLVCSAITSSLFIATIVFVLCCVAVSLLITYKISVHQDVIQTAYVLSDGKLWFLKLCYINNRGFAGHAGTAFNVAAETISAIENQKNEAIMNEHRARIESYENGFCEAVKSNQFTLFGPQMITKTSSGSVEIIRLDRLNVSKEKEDSFVISYRDCRGKKRLIIIGEAFPGLRQKMLSHVTNESFSDEFPKKYTPHIVNKLISVFLASLVLIYALFGVPSDIKNYIETHMDYTVYISDEMISETLGGHEFKMDSYDSDFRDGTFVVFL